MTRSTPAPLAEMVGRRIRALRHEKGLTLAQLEERTGVPRAHISRIERGFVMIELGTVEKIARGLEVLVLDVFTFPEEDDHQRFVDLTRHASPEKLAALERTVESLFERATSRRSKRDVEPH